MDIKEVIGRLSEYYKKGVVIVGPDGSDRNKLRVYANGGLIGRIAMNNEGRLVTVGSDAYDEHLNDDKKEQLKEIKKNAKDSRKDSDNILTNKDYIELMLEATNNKGHKKSSYKGQRLKGERLIQTTLISQQNNLQFRENNDEFLVYDLEYMMTCPTRKAENEFKQAKPDFMVFDGKNIGFVEMKYDADSMIGVNSLTNHYLDFIDIINDDSSIRNVIKETIYRLDCLLKFEIINCSWKNSIKDIQSLVENSSAEELRKHIWIGFLFVEGPHKKRKGQAKKMIACQDYIKEQLTIQLKDVMSDNKNIMVRYGYCNSDINPKMILDRKLVVKNINGEQIVSIENL